MIGQVVNTNAASMSQMLTKAGMDVIKVETVGDDIFALSTALSAAIEESDAVILTGGLGPTKDDLTKKFLTDYFGGELRENAEQLAIIEDIFKKRGYPMTPVNRQQSMTPSSCTTIPNTMGTAPAMWFEKEGHVVASIPGVPYEALHLMRTEIVPRLRKRFHTEVILTKNIIVQGIGESFLSDLIEHWELSLPKHIGLAYLPQAGMTKLRLTAHGKDRNILQNEVGQLVQALYAIAGTYIAGEDCETLAELVHQMFLQKHLSLATAEYCTGGNLARQLYALQNSSEYYKGGIVCPSNDAMQTFLGIREETLERHSAASEQAACEMANSICCRLDSDFAVAVSGVIDTGKETNGQRAGTVWIAVSGPRGTEAHLCHFGGNDRLRIIERATNEAFHLLIKATR